MSVSHVLKTNNDEYKVKERTRILIKQKLGFGEYRTEWVKRNWTRVSFRVTGFHPGYRWLYLAIQQN